MPPSNRSKPQISDYLWFLQVITVLVLTSVVIWLTLRPKIPIFTITNVNIPALRRTNSTFTNTSVILNMEIFNPNKRIGIFYDNIRVNLYYNNSTFGSNSLQGFYQQGKDTASREVAVNADQRLMTDHGSSSREMRICLESIVRYKIVNSKAKHHRIDLEAYVEIGSDGSILGEKNITLHRMLKHIENGN